MDGVSTGNDRRVGREGKEGWGGVELGTGEVGNQRKVGEEGEDKKGRAAGAKRVGGDSCGGREPRKS